MSFVPQQYLYAVFFVDAICDRSLKLSMIMYITAAAFCSADPFSGAEENEEIMRVVFHW